MVRSRSTAILDDAEQHEGSVFPQQQQPSKGASPASLIAVNDITSAVYPRQISLSQCSSLATPPQHVPKPRPLLLPNELQQNLATSVPLVQSPLGVASPKAPIPNVLSPSGMPSSKPPLPQASPRHPLAHCPTMSNLAAAGRSEGSARRAINNPMPLQPIRDDRSNNLAARPLFVRGDSLLLDSNESSPRTTPSTRAVSGRTFVPQALINAFTTKAVELDVGDGMGEGVFVFVDR